MLKNVDMRNGTDGDNPTSRVKRNLKRHRHWQMTRACSAAMIMTVQWGSVSGINE